jgi:hypothetical protein
MKLVAIVAAIFVGCAFQSFATAQTPTSPEDPEKAKPVAAAEAVEKTEFVKPAVVAPVMTKDDIKETSENRGLTDLEKLNAALKVKHDSDPLSSPSIAETVLTKKSPSSPRQDSSSSDWHFAFAPYLFAAGITGTVGARGRTLELDADFSGSVWESLDFGLMGAFEARKGRFVSFTDFMWIKLSKEEDTPRRFYDTAKLGVNFLMIDPEIGYRLVDSDKYALDVLGGVRIWSVETNLNVTTGILPGFDVSQRKTWAAPVVGLHGVASVTPKFFLAGKFDIGGVGIGADLTTQLYGAAGYRITNNVALIAGYRWLQVDYDDDEGFIFDTQMQGLMFGLKFSF